MMTPELFVARERLLEGIMATWKQPASPTKQREVTSSSSFRDDLLAGLGVVIGHHASRVRETRAAERAMIDAKTTMPNNYWVPRMKAEQHLKTALAMLDAVLES